MLKTVSGKSSKTIVPELDLFSMPNTAVGVVASRYIECPLTNAISSTAGSTPGPLEWRYNLQKNYLNLQRSYLQFTIGIRDDKGKRITVASGQHLPLAFCNAIGKTLFRQFLVYVNGVLVEDSSPLYAWRSMIETELNHDSASKSTSLSLAGYAFDEKPSSATSPGHLRRQSWVQPDGDAQFAATLNLNLFNQSRLLLNYVDFKLIAYLNDPKFVIDSFELDGDTRNYRYEIVDIKLLLHEYELHDSASTAIEQMLKQNKALTYPLTNVEMRSFYVAPGRFDSPECRLLTSALPKRVIMCMVDSDSFLGNHRKTPFDFRHFDIKDAFLDCGGRSIPARPLNLNFEKNLYMPAYLNMLEGTGIARTTLSNGITREAFKNGFAFFVFEVSPSLDSDTFDLISLGTTSFNMSFNKAVPAGGIYCILHCEYDSVLTIDENRVPHVDAIM